MRKNDEKNHLYKQYDYVVSRSEYRKYVQRFSSYSYCLVHNLLDGCNISKKRDGIASRTRIPKNLAICNHNSLPKPVSTLVAVSTPAPGPFPERLTNPAVIPSGREILRDGTTSFQHRVSADASKTLPSPIRGV